MTWDPALEEQAALEDAEWDAHVQDFWESALRRCRELLTDPKPSGPQSKVVLEQRIAMYEREIARVSRGV